MIAKNVMYLPWTKKKKLKKFMDPEKLKILRINDKAQQQRIHWACDDTFSILLCMC